MRVLVWYQKSGSIQNFGKRPGAAQEHMVLGLAKAHSAQHPSAISPVQQLKTLKGSCHQDQ